MEKHHYVCVCYCKAYILQSIHIKAATSQTSASFPTHAAGLMMLAASFANSEARALSAAAARQLSAAAKQANNNAAAAPPVVLSFSELKPTLSSTWVPSIQADHPSVQVPVAGIPGTPSTPETMSRISYTVTYTKRPAYVLQGSISVSTAAFSSTDGGTATYTLQNPNITITQKGSAESQQIPAQTITCSSYTLEPAGGSIKCSFKAQIFTFLEPAPPGSAQASIQLLGGLQSTGNPASIKTPVTAFDWPVSTGSSNSNMRLSSPDSAQQFLQDTMQSGGPSNGAGGGSSNSAGSAATVTNFFEPGEGRLLPKGVQGIQPAANSVLQDTASFTYVALIPDIPKELCHKPLQVGVLTHTHTKQPAVTSTFIH